MASGTASAQQAQANSQAVLAALVRYPEGTSPLELTAQLDLGQSTVYRALDRLQAEGLARKLDRGRWTAQQAQDRPAGPVRPTGPPTLQRAVATPQRPPLGLLAVSGPPDPDRFAQALAALPAEEHRAMVRLETDVIIARRHLAEDLATGWPFFAHFGGTGSGKSLGGSVVCRGLGLDQTIVRRLPAGETEKSLWGDHRPPLFLPAEALSYPLLWLDELESSKVEASIRNMLRRHMEGDSVTTVRTTRVVIRPVVLTCSNIPDLEGMPEDQQRRAFILATRPLGRFVDKEAVDDAAEAILDPGGHLGLDRPPPLPLDLLRPPLQVLSQPAKDLIKALVGVTLSPDGLALTDRTCIAQVVLGRLARWAGGRQVQVPVEDELAAVWDVMADVAIVAQTVGWTRRDWRDPFDQAPAELATELAQTVAGAVDLAQSAQRTPARSAERISKQLAASDRQTAVHARLEVPRQALGVAWKAARDAGANLEAYVEQVTALDKALANRQELAEQVDGPDLEALTENAEPFVSAGLTLARQLQDLTAALRAENEDQDQTEAVEVAALDELEARRTRRVRALPGRPEAWSVGSRTNQVLDRLGLGPTVSAPAGWCATWDSRMEQPCGMTAVGRIILGPQAWTPVCRACQHAIQTRAAERGRKVSFIPRDDLGTEAVPADQQVTAAGMLDAQRAAFLRSWRVR